MADSAKEAGYAMDCSLQSWKTRADTQALDPESKLRLLLTPVEAHARGRPVRPPRI